MSVREFHDATIDTFLTVEDRIVLEMEDVSVYADPEIPDGTHESGKLTISNVRRVLEDGVDVTRPSFSFEYGRVLDLVQTSEGITLRVEWQFPDPRATRFAEYTIYGNTMHWEPAASFPPIGEPS
jgi:hypothetical protein